MRGIVRRKVDDGGFCFLNVPGEDFPRGVFLHMNDLRGVEFHNLREGMAVEFVLQQSEKGPRAMRARIVEAVSP
jgi:cold shock CspA family protein